MTGSGSYQWRTAMQIAADPSGATSALPGITSSPSTRSSSTGAPKVPPGGLSDAITRVGAPVPGFAGVGDTSGSQATAAAPEPATPTRGGCAVPGSIPGAVSRVSTA